MKKLFIMLVAIASIVCMFAITSSAAVEPNNDGETYTAIDGTVLALYDKENKPLAWFYTESTGYVPLRVGVDFNITLGYLSKQLDQNCAITYTTGNDYTFTVKEMVLLNGREFVDLKMYGGSWSATIIQAIYTHNQFEHINKSSFNNCKTLAVFDIPKDTKTTITIGGFAFANSGLKRFYIPKNAVLQDSGYGGSCTFEKSALEFVEFDDDFNGFIGIAFNGCKSLKAVSLPKNMTTIGAKEFCDCSALTAVYLPESLETFGTNAGSGAGAFVNCTNMYFVDKPFDIDDCFVNGEFVAPAKPDVYVMPAGITSLVGETFKNCKALNTTIVFPGVTSVENGWAFGRRDEKTVKNIVFLADVKTFTYSNEIYYLNFYFCNEKTTPSTITFTQKSSPNNSFAYICSSGVKSNLNNVSSTTFAETGFAHIQSNVKDIVSEATCVDYAVYATKCFCGASLGNVNGTELDPDNHDLENATLVSIVYAKYTDKGVKKVACGRSCGENVDLDVDPIFETLGYSIKENNGYGIMSTYVINDVALKEYEDLNGPITFGIIMANANIDGQSAFMSKNDQDKYVLNSSYGVQLEIKNRDYSKINATIDQFTQDEASLNLVMALYVIEDDNVTYIQHEGTYAGEITKDATLDIVTITKIAEIKGIQITLPEPALVPAGNDEE